MSRLPTAGSARALGRALRDYFSARTARNEAAVLFDSWRDAAGFLDRFRHPPSIGLVGIPREQVQSLWVTADRLAKSHRTLLDEFDLAAERRFRAVQDAKIRLLLELPDRVASGDFEFKLRDLVAKAIDSADRALGNRADLVGSLLAHEHLFAGLRWPRASRAARQRVLEENTAVKLVLRRFEGELEVLEGLARDEPVVVADLLRATRTAAEFEERVPFELSLKVVTSEEEALRSLGEANVRVQVSGLDFIRRLARAGDPQALEVPRRLEELRGRMKVER